MKPVYLRGSTMVPTGGKVVNFRHCESLKNQLSGTFCSPKLSLESWITLHCLHKNFPEYPHDITGISIVVSSTELSWLKNYKLSWFSNLFLALLSLVIKNTAYPIWDRSYPFKTQASSSKQECWNIWWFMTSPSAWVTFDKLFICYSSI